MRKRTIRQRALSLPNWSVAESATERHYRRHWPLHSPTLPPGHTGLKADRVCRRQSTDGWRGLSGQSGLAAAAARKPTVAYYTRYFSYLQSGFLPMELASYSDALHPLTIAVHDNFP